MRRYIRYVYELVKGLKPSDDGTIWGAEVGVWRGNCAWHLLRSVPELRLWLVDSYEEESLEWNRLTVGHSKISARQAFDVLFPFRGRCRWLLMPSVEAAGIVADESLDYAFIDADHRYPAVKSDILAWKSKVRPGGLLIGDDIDYDTVKTAVEEEFGRRYNKKGAIWWIEL